MEPFDLSVFLVLVFSLACVFLGPHRIMSFLCLSHILVMFSFTTNTTFSKMCASDRFCTDGSHVSCFSPIRPSSLCFMYVVPHCPSLHQKGIYYYQKLLEILPGQKKKRPLRLCIKSEHCFYHGISKIKLDCASVCSDAQSHG